MRKIFISFFVTGAALSGWLLAEAATLGVRPTHDHQVAAHLVSLYVPADRQTYFLFDLNEHGDADNQANKLAKNLGTANKENQYFGLIGSDPAHNRQVLRRAVERSQDQRFPDVTLVIVGPSDDEQRFRQLAEPLDSRVIYAVYP